MVPVCPALPSGASLTADSTPVPFINFHGTDDLVPYSGGNLPLSARPFPSVLE